MKINEKKEKMVFLRWFHVLHFSFYLQVNPQWLWLHERGWLPRADMGGLFSETA